MAAHVHVQPADFPPVMLWLFIAANVVIALGYGVLCVAWVRLVPYARSPRTRWAMLCTAVFFAGCVGTHIMAIGEPHASLFWVAWHVAQAAGTWGSILLGWMILRDAFTMWNEWERSASQTAAREASHDGPPD